MKLFSTFLTVAFFLVATSAQPFTHRHSVSCTDDASCQNTDRLKDKRCVEYACQLEADSSTRWCYSRLAMGAKCALAGFDCQGNELCDLDSCECVAEEDQGNRTPKSCYNSTECPDLDTCTFSECLKNPDSSKGFCYAVLKGDAECSLAPAANFRCLDEPNGVCRLDQVRSTCVCDYPPAITSSPAGSRAPSAAGAPATSPPVSSAPSCNGNSGRCMGDPHFTTWDGVQYDFHGACDLVLVHHPEFANGLGLYIHIRTKHRGLIGSYIESAALRIGDDTLEVKAITERKTVWWLNGIQNAELDSATVSGYPISHYVAKQTTMDSHRFNVDLGGGLRMMFKTHKNLINVRFWESSPQGALSGSIGLLGDRATGAMLRRNLEEHTEDADAFGNEWQVKGSDFNLFHDLGDGPHHPQGCSMIDPIEKEEEGRLRRRLSTAISDDEAQAVCSNVADADQANCIFDVVTLNDVDMAGLYQEEEEEFA